MAHLIYVKAKDDKRFSYVKFGNYTMRSGKKSVLLNPDDLVIDGSLREQLRKLESQLIWNYRGKNNAA